jgi:hypothetical protein
MRSVAAALGKQALKMHRVTYTAQEAILKIKGEPASAWNCVEFNAMIRA